MTAEILASLYRPLRVSISFLKQNSESRGIPSSNTDIILSTQALNSFEEPLCADECIPINFCDDI